jgi:hypothetical protein
MLIFHPDTQPVSYDRAFAGRGVSLYVSAGSDVQYRRLRVCQAGQMITQHVSLDQFPATLRRAKADHPATTLDWTIPAEMLPAFGETATIAVDVRPFRDDVELDTRQRQTIEIDSAGNLVSTLGGTAELLNQVQQAGGVVKLEFAYYLPEDEAEPFRFRWVATDGPTSPADAVVTHSPGSTRYSVLTPALSDAAAYTYTLQAENEAGDVVLELLTGVSVLADASGPPAPGSPLAKVV